MKNNKKALCAALTLALSLGFAGNAFAEEANPDFGGGAELFDVQNQPMPEEEPKYSEEVTDCSCSSPV